MKYSFMSFSTPDLTLEEIIEVAKKYGYEGFEARIDSGHRHGIEPFTEKQKLKEKKSLSRELAPLMSPLV